MVKIEIESGLGLRLALRRLGQNQGQGRIMARDRIRVPPLTKVFIAESITIVSYPCHCKILGVGYVGYRFDCGFSYG